MLQRKRNGGSLISEEESKSERAAYPRSLESPFAELLGSYRYNVPLSIKFCIKVCDLCIQRAGTTGPQARRLASTEKFAVSELFR